MCKILRTGRHTVEEEKMDGREGMVGKVSGSNETGQVWEAGV